MRELMERRRRELAGEFETGERLLAELTARQDELRRNLLRIGGAVRILDELLAEPAPAAADAPVLRRAVAG